MISRRLWLFGLEDDIVRHTTGTILAWIRQQQILLRGGFARKERRKTRDTEYICECLSIHL